ncbi:hypothetical protein J4214_02325 [Candidatus Woesearchaeota archaeon]|nr:hypothetical protein [Candidatus Woesearchaeota archaeon]
MVEKTIRVGDYQFKEDNICYINQFIDIRVLSHLEMSMRQKNVDEPKLVVINTMVVEQVLFLMSY